ncbi:MAG: hypothetical protein QGF20_10360 [Alphaproteobacteria bacterium]|jgi:presenilin-like A22 family membrane protease|nr:hypothetical protein [Alphaproteobacteria bacterium]
MPENQPAKSKFYVRSLIIVSAGGITVGAMGFVVQGLFFGFDNVTIFTILPAFFYGVLGTAAVLYLVARNRAKSHPPMDYTSRLNC